MNILTPEMVRKDSQRDKLDAQRRARDLAAEEERLIKSVNSLRDEETVVRESTEKNIADLEQMASERKRELMGEITTLEARKVEAMKPVEDLRAEAERVLSAAKEREAAVAKREEAMDEKEEVHMERLEKLHDQEGESKIRAENLDTREAQVKKEEERSRTSLGELSEKWAEYHTRVNAANAAIAKREAAVEAREKAAAIKAEEQRQKDEDYKEKDREIQSRYAQLEKTSEEFYKLKNEDHG